MDKHTPGPWHWDDAVWEAYDPLERAPWLIPTNNDKGFVLMGAIKCNSKADARLIAAAPTMYEYIESSALNGCAAAKKILEAIHGNA